MGGRGTESPAFNEDTRHIPGHQECVSGRQRGFDIDGGQDLTSHDRGPMSSKPSSPSEEPDSKILRGYCGAKELSNPDPLCTRPKARTEEGKMPEDARRKPKHCRDDAEDDLVLGTLDPKRKGRHVVKGNFPEHPQKKGRVQKDTHGGMV